MPDVPEWIDTLVESVARHLTAAGPLGPLGVRFREEDDGDWEVVIHPTPVELVGGASDGAVFSPAFEINLEGLRAEFEKLTAMVISSHGLYEDEDSYCRIEGTWQGRPLTLRFLLKPPEDEEPGSKMKVDEREE
ncbi:MAG: hypothetical protein IT367_21700 [Candidatus Hydrogenedentes bacterium]|nr:hypothetical protein [Candidatus Hydrogenedentota bacterium]